MKVIDLLNKIANGEEVPKKIHYNCVPLYWCEPCKIYETMTDDELCGKDLYTLLDNLNDEVEILEEPKGIPKRIQSNGENLYSEYVGQWLTNKENYTEYDELLMNKINEIIDYLENKGESND